MSTILNILFLVVAGVMLVFLIKKAIFIIYNIAELNDKRSCLDSSKQRHGIVFNKRTKQLEADQSVILPFE